jgi:hypothetical protein
MIRDKELERLKKYAEALGLKLNFKSRKPHGPDAAEWAIDGTELWIHVGKKDSKTYTILSFIHELGHMLEHIHNNDRQVDPALEEAVDNEEEKKKHRKKIYDWELQGTKWWETIYKETDMKFPKWKLNAQRELDLWQYEVYYETGTFPLRYETKEKYQLIKEKNRKKHG